MSRPERRKKSSLAGLHPAKPPTVEPAPTVEAVSAVEPAPVQPPVPEDTNTSTVTESLSLAPAHADVQTGALADARPRRSDPVREQRARARAEVERVALSWGAARRKLGQRETAWIDALSRARELGALPGVLGDYVREGAERAGIDPVEVPVEVWRAAGLDHP